MHNDSATHPLPNLKVKGLLLRLTYAFLHVVTPAAAMLWTWISLTLFVMFVTWVAAVARFRSSMTKAADDLRNLGRDFRQQAQQLTSIRQAERESKRESTKRGRELTTLRTRVQSLTTSLNSVTAERDSLKTRNESAETRISRLSEQLAASQANTDRLRIELDDATEIRWKLMSRIHTEAAQRAVQFDQVQRSHLSLSHQTSPAIPRRSNSVTPAIEGPSSEAGQPEESTGSSASAGPSKQQPSETAPAIVREPQDEDDVVSAVERDLNHSVSVEDLLQLKPDLSVPEQDEPSDEPLQFEDSDECRGSRVLQSMFETMPSNARNDEPELLSLDRAPWVDTVSADLTRPSAGSIAAAIQPAIARKRPGWVVSGMRVADHYEGESSKS